MSLKDTSASPKRSTPRKPYTSPRLVSYGHVKDIIQGGGGKKFDSGGTKGAGNSKGCWIAEALYGVDDPRTLLLRAWLGAAYDERRPGWPLIAAYHRFGYATAQLIHRGYLPRGVFRPLFDTLVARALTDSARAIVAER